MNKESDVDFSPISCLPDDIVLEIFHNKVMDLKTLCLCKVVSKRFHAIVHQVHTIRAVGSEKYSLTECKENYWLMKSIGMFKKVKSVSIHIPDYDNYNTSFLGKWKVKMSLNRIDSFVMVLPTSIYDNKGLLLYEKKHFLDKFLIAMLCLTNALLRVYTSWCIMNQGFPLLEKVTITDSENKGRVYVNELTKWKSSTNSSFVPRVSECSVPALELPVSGYVMKEVSLVLVENKDLPDDRNYDRFIDDHDQIDYDKHDKQEAAYHEAMMEIFKKHKGSFVRRPLDDELESWISE